MSRTKGKARSASVVDTIERAVNLLRSDLSGFGFYHLLGSVPFWLYVVWFVEFLSYGKVHAADLALHAFALAALYTGMRAMHSLACESGRRKILGEERLAWSFRDFLRLYLVQLRLGGASLWFCLLSANILVSSGLSFAYSQHAVASAYRSANAQECRSAAWRAASSNAGSSYAFLGLYCLLWIVIWLNLAILFYFVPDFLRSLLGLQNLTSVEGWNLFSTTFFTITFASTSLLANALSKSYHTIASFETEAQTTGQDILARLDRIPLAKHLAAIAIAVIAIGGGPSAFAEERDGSKTSLVEIARFDGAVDDALSEPDYYWRDHSTSNSPANSPLLDRLSKTTKSVFKWIVKALRWLTGKNPANSTPNSPIARDTGSAMDLGSIAIILAIILILFAVVALLLRFNKEPPPELDPANLPKPTEPDLRDESISAADMPFDRWLAIAADKAAAGEHRLAIRAVFLAALALLADRKLIILAASKANFEYERELRRRSLAPEVKGSFQECKSVFDRTWYGSHRADDQTYSSILAAYGTIEGRSR